LGDQIGSGTQGTVHRAVRIVPEGGAIHEVCVKLLGQGVAPDDAQKRNALRETEIATRLQHPNTVSCIEARPDDPEGGWIAMEFVDGVNLRALLRSLPAQTPDAPARTLSPELAVFVASEVCKALIYLHSQRRRGDSEPFIVHHDLKSSNVLIGRAGFVKLADFGLARVFQAFREPMTFVGGTLQYMAPEQAEGIPVDGRSDLFSLGVILYEMLAGRLPVEGMSDAETKRRLATCDYPSIRTLNPKVPPALASIVACLMQPDPERRFSTARACLRAFSEFTRAELPLDLDLCLQLGDLAKDARRHRTQDPEALLREHRQRISDAVDVLPEPLPEVVRAPKEPLASAHAVAAAEGARVQNAPGAAGLNVRPEGAKPRRLSLGVAAAAAALALPLGVGAWTLQSAEGEPPRATTKAAATAAPMGTPTVLSSDSHASTASGAAQAPQTAPTTLVAPPTEAPAEAPVTTPSKPLHPAQKKEDKAASKAAKQADAKLTIGAWPSALVWVDGKSVGYSPKDVDVSAGKHSVGIGAKKPAKEALRSVTVQAGEHLDVVFDEQSLASVDVRDEH
jgi:serine/threonine protein kinase